MERCSGVEMGELVTTNLGTVGWKVSDLSSDEESLVWSFCHRSSEVQKVEVRRVEV